MFILANNTPCKYIGWKKQKQQQVRIANYVNQHIDGCENEQV
jgi:hypothetical protein